MLHADERITTARAVTPLTKAITTPYMTTLPRPCAQELAMAWGTVQSGQGAQGICSRRGK